MSLQRDADNVSYALSFSFFLTRSFCEFWNFGLSFGIGESDGERLGGGRGCFCGFFLNFFFPSICLKFVRVCGEKDMLCVRVESFVIFMRWTVRAP